MIGAFSTVTKGLLKALEDLEYGGRVETIQTTALFRTARILRRLQETEVICCHSNFSEKQSANADEKNFFYRNKKKMFPRIQNHKRNIIARDKINVELRKENPD